MRILVIEDEPAIADFVARGLGAEGYAVTCATDGIEGERDALREEVDLVILDLVLPGRPGLEVLRRLRAAKPELPVIVSMKEGGWSSAVRCGGFRGRGRVGGGERRSSLYRPFGLGTVRNGRFAPVAQFLSPPGRKSRLA
jgi:CheY-like chemotaxis protein